MSFRRLLILGLAAALVAFFTVIYLSRRSPSDRTFAIQGQVQSITPDRQEAMIKHGEIKGLMPAMTMPYRFKMKTELDALKPGDLIDGRLIILTNDAYLADVKKTGEAPIEKSAAEAVAAASAAGAKLLQPGQTVPDGDFIDQNNRKTSMQAFRGSTVVLTFIYTRCPLPTFCPMMDRHFETLQERMRSDPALKKVHLVTVSFDPAHDTPAVLREHAKELMADLSTWTFLTGKPTAIDDFAGKFGVYVVRNPADERDITHNLRTAVIGPDGVVKKLYTGNEWTPEDVLADLKPTANAD